ncbi:hypothetical protein HPB51_004520 [Rhipicephalus microplus]|uniref:Uncharacterized protein n=1 Tax=Rhipicephalus microplus TaxID=6941 RepID=A0A9J6EM06_RHIMP|nr:hypothetical protein HPB51_004520 [Rhipicephalus microplus]
MACVPIGPKGRVIKDCEWRYRHANVTDDVLSCKKCVKDYELRFPPRRLDVVKMRQTCVKPYTPKEAAIILCNAFHRPSRANLTECERCVNESSIAENATFAEYKKLEAECMPRAYPKDRIRRLCKWRFIEQEEVHQCEECVDNYTLPAVFEYEDPSRKELLRKSCDWYYKYQEVEKAQCEACVEKSNLHEDASYAYEAQVRSVCMPREDIERCRKCAEEYMNDNDAANEVHSLDVQQLYRKCLSGNNLKYRLIEECQQKIQEPVSTAQPLQRTFCGLPRPLRPCEVNIANYVYYVFFS